MVFCRKHRLPENHYCTFFFQFEESEKIRYQDILDYMRKNLSVADIYHYFTTKEYTEAQTLELLQHFIEQNDNPEIRIYSLEALKLLDLDRDKVFTILEASVLSDADSNVREIGIKILKEIFPEKSKNILKWIEDR
jgi:AcrR family transcriptional regulator